jgi:hypothetical protein
MSCVCEYKMAAGLCATEYRAAGIFEYGTDAELCKWQSNSWTMSVRTIYVETGVIQEYRTANRLAVN